nr:cytochrome c [Verrucomicrobiota bacterium]
MKFARHINLWTGLPLLSMLLGFASSHGAEEHPLGREIYRAQCTKCHGDKGEGVEGEYEEPLQGDWSIAKLARVIAKTMPEDDPGTCAGPDAGAVARYIYDAFYSRDARQRNQPARVELARLTNRQYLNTAADLIRHFSGGGNPVVLNERGGLSASYFNSRRFDRSKKITERVDGALQFDFAQASPDPERIRPEEFAIQWGGSVIAEESGEHEFILTTPNGA